MARITFTDSAAKRIARAVVAFEAGDRNGDGMRLGEAPAAVPPPPLQLGTFTGTWETAQYKTVTLYGSTQTASVYNWCNPALGGSTSNTTESRYVIFGKVRGTHSAVEIQMRSTSTQCTATMVLGSVDLKALPGFVAGEIQLLGHSVINTASTCSGGLQWYSITTCGTATSSP